ncbi:ATP-binding protein [Martelella endophytica]|uniref:histidine kinase n=1 Tax=Martelella endophytica TaxID=1486262 RepID=A0A0D5LU58_MAREN|nr:ATP-binding protein [Martelella endophytica]AJY46878.1 histidine kinase [Martelella endophytica]
MNWLRNRIVILLIVAILSVVGLATFAAVNALQRPDPDTLMLPLARQLATLAQVAEADPSLAAAEGLVMAPAPASGDLDQKATRHVKRALLKVGFTGETLITRPEGGGLTISIDLGEDGFLVMPFPDLRPPPGGRYVFAGWIALIIIGSIAVSVFAASMIMRPLRLIQNAVGSIGPDGMLPHVPETGPPETRMAARALNRLSSHLKAATESRMRLVAAAGHDLRTPMTRMRLRAEFIEEEAEREKWLADLEELDRIADSAIRLVREEVSRDTTAIVDLAALLREIVEGLAPLGMRVDLQATVPVEIEAAPLAIKRALRNLIVNAATHGGGATITLDRDGGEAVITIADEGPGIPEDLLGQVFEPFFRVDLARRKTIPGAGLGLAIAREIIERSGGHITIANRKPSGLLQTVTWTL